jgi:glutamate dehydrogenase (NAD(P)+)
VSDTRSAVFNPRGLNVREVVAHKSRTKALRDLEDSEEISNEELLALPCDILIPAAFENQIRADNVAGVKAKLVAEAANGPTTPAADEILHRRGVPVIPDILANAGGVTVSYFEWVQNIENEQWPEQVVNDKLRAKMVASTDAVLDMHQRLRRDLRTAAFAVAITRVSRVAQSRGIWP